MKKYKVINFLLIALVSLIGILVAFPIFWMIRSSLVSKAQFFSRPPVIWPSKMLFSNFTKAMERIDFGRQLWNSVSIVVPCDWKCDYVVFLLMHLLELSFL